tara:strand:+ start:379 stop:765 length:387 start_codon:yes stop_codon:yes gene_type:complete
MQPIRKNIYDYQNEAEDMEEKYMMELGKCQLLEEKNKELKKSVVMEMRGVLYYYKAQSEKLKEERREKRKLKKNYQQLKDACCYEMCIKCNNHYPLQVEDSILYKHDEGWACYTCVPHFVDSDTDEEY